MTHENHTTSAYIVGLRDRLRLHGITHGALSRQSGIDGSQIARWINGRARPNERSIVRIEAAVAAIAPSAALSDFLRPMPLENDEAGEHKRLCEFVAAFRDLIDLHDRTSPRWRYFQTEWLWMYARGMVEGAAAAEVKTRRLAELNTKGESGNEEAAMLSQTSDKKLLHFIKAELYGGPGDGGFVHLRVPAIDQIVVDVPSADGQTVAARYRRAQGAVCDIVQIRRDELNDIDDNFRGKKPAKYIYDAAAEF